MSLCNVSQFGTRLELRLNPAGVFDGLGEQALEVGFGDGQARGVELRPQSGCVDHAVGDVADRVGR